MPFGCQAKHPLDYAGEPFGMSAVLGKDFNIVVN